MPVRIPGIRFVAEAGVLPAPKPIFYLKELDQSRYVAWQREVKDRPARLRPPPR